MVQDEENRMGPYAYKENQWVSYDDKAMIKYKVRAAHPVLCSQYFVCYLVS